MAIFSGIRKYFKNNKNLVNIFLVYFFLTFTIGFLDFDRRVHSFQQSTQDLEDVVTRKALPPMVHRILIPYTVYFAHKVSHFPLSFTFAGFRFFFFFLSFALFHIYLKKWFDDRIAMIGTLSMIASLPLILSNWFCVPTDIPELIAYILGAMWIRDNKYKYLLFLIPIATLNRETTAGLVFLYFINGIGKEKFNTLIKRTSVYFVLWLVPSAILVYIFGLRQEAAFFYVWQHNIDGLLMMFKNPNPYNYYYFLIYLCGFYWVLAFRDFRKKDRLLKRSVLLMIPYFLYAFLGKGSINEVRIFIPFYVFVIPLGLFSLFKEDGNVRVSKTG